MTNNNDINSSEISSDDENKTKNPPTKYDSPWKDILQIYFKDILIITLGSPCLDKYKQAPVSKSMRFV